MNKRRELLWLSASTAALLVFSFTAGYGLRELYALAHGSASQPLRAALDGYRQIASRTGIGTEPDMGPPELYSEVLDRLKTLYVDKLPDSTLMSYSSVEQMLATLDDPNTRLLLPDEASAVKAEADGHFAGIGAVLTFKRYSSADHQAVERQLTVVTPMPGSAAEQAHLMPGDRITEIDGHWIAPLHLWTREMAFMTFNPSAADSTWRKDPDAEPDPDGGGKITPQQRKEAEEAQDKLYNRWRTSTDLGAAMDLLTTATSGDHTLTIERPGEAKPREVKVTLGSLQISPVSTRILPGNIGYVQLHQICPETVSALASGLKELHDGGAQTLVLDLRSSPGGSLEAAQKIAGLLVPSGTFVQEQRRDEQRKMVDKSLSVEPPSSPAPKFSSIAVLIDKGTAGTAELLAGALRDHDIAKLYGGASFGDGTEQTIFPLDNGAAVSITSARFFTPRHTDFDGKGLKPDVSVPAGPGLDRQLEQAVKSLRA